MSIQKQSQETVHHFWARFLLVKDKVKDCRDEDAISAFRNNCTDEGILNAINRRRILHFADLGNYRTEVQRNGKRLERSGSLLGAIGPNSTAGPGEKGAFP